MLWKSIFWTWTYFFGRNAVAPTDFEALLLSNTKIFSLSVFNRQYKTPSMASNSIIKQVIFWVRFRFSGHHAQVLVLLILWMMFLKFDIWVNFLIKMMLSAERDATDKSDDLKIRQIAVIGCVESISSVSKSICPWWVSEKGYYWSKCCICKSFIIALSVFAEVFSL